MGHVIYLTGAPATGKSTLCQYLSEHNSSVLTYSYSKLLRDYINEKRDSRIDETNIREKSALLVTKEDVEAIDNWLIDKVKEQRRLKDIIIDSHAVTKEGYGFRVTPFTPDKLAELNPDAIVCLYASPEILEERIKSDPAGRPLPSRFELGLHVELQSSLAAQYSSSIGKPLYLIDSAYGLSDVAHHVASVTNLALDIGN